VLLCLDLLPELANDLLAALAARVELLLEPAHLLLPLDLGLVVHAVRLVALPHEVAHARVELAVPRLELVVPQLVRAQLRRERRDGLRVVAPRVAPQRSDLALGVAQLAAAARVVAALVRVVRVPALLAVLGLVVRVRERIVVQGVVRLGRVVHAVLGHVVRVRPARHEEGRLALGAVVGRPRCRPCRLGDAQALAQLRELVALAPDRVERLGALTAQARHLVLRARLVVPLRLRVVVLVLVLVVVHGARLALALVAPRLDLDLGRVDGVGRGRDGSARCARRVDVQAQVRERLDDARAGALLALDVARGAAGRAAVLVADAVPLLDAGLRGGVRGASGRGRAAGEERGDARGGRRGRSW